MTALESSDLPCRLGDARGSARQEPCCGPQYAAIMSQTASCNLPVSIAWRQTPRDLTKKREEKRTNNRSWMGKSCWQRLLGRNDLGTLRSAPHVGPVGQVGHHLTSALLTRVYVLAVSRQFSGWVKGGSEPSLMKQEKHTSLSAAEPTWCKQPKALSSITSGALAAS